MARSKNRLIMPQLNLNICDDEDVIVDCVAACVIAYARSRHKAISDELIKFFTKKDIISNNTIENFIKLICEMSLDQAAYWLSTIYSYSSKARRLHFGMYFTPTDLATFLIQRIKAITPNFNSSIIFDPASGGGAFLVPVARILKEELKKEGVSPLAILDHITTHLRGADIDEGLNSLTKAFLIMQLEDEIIASGSFPEFNIKTIDSLSSDMCMSPNCDIIICNPPYRRLSKVEYANWDSEEAYSAKLCQNLFSCFVVKSFQYLKASGKAAFITPGSFFCGRTYQKLRDYILDHACVHFLFSIAQREGLFFNVEQDTVLFCIEKLFQGTPDGEEVEAGHLYDMNHQYISRTILNRREPWPVAKSDSQLIDRNCGVYNIADYGYEIHAGSVVWNRDNRPFLQRVPKKSKNIYPLLWSKCVAPGGEFDHSRAPRVTSGTGKTKGPFIKLTSGEEAGLFRVPGVLVKRTTSTSQSRRLHCSSIPEEFVREYGGYLGENHVYLLVPKKNVNQAVSVEILAAILNTDIVDQAYRRISLTASVSKYELLRLPLPSPSTLVSQLALGLEIESAVSRAYELGVNSAQNEIRNQSS